MPGVITRDEIIAMLRYTVRGLLTLRLFSNDATPSRIQLVSNFIEADFPGYEPIQLDYNLWVEDGTDPIILRYPKQTFRLTEDLSSYVRICGHYLTRGDAVVMAERDGDRVHKLEVAHSRIEVMPILTER